MQFCWVLLPSNNYRLCLNIFSTWLRTGRVTHVTVIRGWTVSGVLYEDTWAKWNHIVPYCPAGRKKCLNSMSKDLLIQKDPGWVEIYCGNEKLRDLTVQIKLRIFVHFLHLILRWPWGRFPRGSGAYFADDTCTVFYYYSLFKTFFIMVLMLHSQWMLAALELIQNYFPSRQARTTATRSW